MLENVLQRFAGGANFTQSDELHGHVDTMIQQAPDEHVTGAIGDALQGLGPQGFGASVTEAAQGMNPQQQGGLMGILSHAIESGGGSLQGALNSTGLGGVQGGGYSPGGLGALASYALQNHGSSLTSVLGDHANSNGSGVLKLLGNPTVQRVGMHLAQRLLSRAM